MYWLIETRQNRFTYSEELDSAGWTNQGVTVAADAATAPDGSVTADRLTDTSTTTDAYIRGEIALADDTYTASIFAKQDTATYVVLGIDHSADGQSGIVIDISNGTVVGSVWTNALDSYTISTFPDNWYRISATRAVSSGTIRPYFYPDNFLSNSAGYGGVSATFAWGFQVEDGLAPGPYTMTTSPSELGALDAQQVPPEYSYQRSGRKEQSQHRTPDGSRYVYRWGGYETHKVPVTFVDSEFRSVVNSWWDDNTNLLWTENDGVTVSSVQIVNKSKPIDRFMVPYDDQFKGTIELETY